MIKKSLLALVAVSILSLVVTTGCSKSQSAVACGSFLSVSGIGSYFLKKHFKRNQTRKHELFNLKYSAKVTDDKEEVHS